MPSAELRALDLHTDDTWLSVTAALPDRLVFAQIRRKHADALQAVVQTKGDLIDFLEKSVPLGHRVKIVPYRQLREAAWHSDDAEVCFRFSSPQNDKVVKESWEFSEQSARAEFIALALRESGAEFAFAESKSSLWRTGAVPLFLSGLALLFFVVLGVVGIYHPEWVFPKPRDGGVRGRNQAMKQIFSDLFYALGPAGFIGLGLALFAVLMIWWAIAHRRSQHKKFVATISGSLGQSRV